MIKIKRNRMFRENRMNRNTYKRSRRLREYIDIDEDIVIYFDGKKIYTGDILAREARYAIALRMDGDGVKSDYFKHSVFMCLCEYDPDRYQYDMDLRYIDDMEMAEDFVNIVRDVLIDSPTIDSAVFNVELFDIFPVSQDFFS